MTTPTTPPRWRLRLIQGLTVIILIGAAASAFYLRDHIQDLAGLGYLAVFVVGLVSNATVILPIPGLAVSSLMGGVFNPWIVGLVAGIGQGLGELSGYMLGYSGQGLVEQRTAYEKITAWMERNGMLTIFVLALIPSPLFDLAGIAAGALRMPISKFLFSCISGKIVKNIIFALLGYLGVSFL